jgi:hypothetical protein
MAGLLDLFGGEDPQQQGLLGLTAGILGASGPSRMPVSLGQVLGAGLGGFHEAQRNALAQQAARQSMAINSIKLKDAESDLQNQEALRQRTANLQKDSAEFWKTGGQPAPAFPGGQSASTMMGNAVSMNGTPVPQPALDAPTSPVPAGRNATPYQQRLAYAQFLRSKGYSSEAQAEEDSALKLQPKVKEWSKVTVGGKVMYAPYFEDGTSGQPVPLEVAEKLDSINRGGSTEMVNPYTGATVRSLTNSASPDAVLSARTAANRLSFDKSQANKPQFVADAGGFVSPPSAGAPQGSFAAIPGYTKSADKQKAQDASDVLALLDQATPLIDKATSSYGGAGVDQAARVFGISTQGSQAASQLKALEGMLVSKMPKMSGPQSDKDVLLYKQMAGQIGDPTVPKENKVAAMETIREINQRYLNQAGGAQLRPQQQAAKPAPKSVLKGQVMDGYRFKGGNPADPNAWEKL